MQSNTSKTKKTRTSVEESTAIGKPEVAIVAEENTKSRRSGSLASAPTDGASPVKKHRRAAKKGIEGDGKVGDATPADAAIIDGTLSIQPASVLEVTREDIAKLAYSYWLERGRQHGNETEDWLRAERKLSVR